MVSGPRRFRTTRWSVVRAAADTGNPESEEALAHLCRTYWPPVYAYVRRRGWDPETARDLTQGFFTRLLEKKGFRVARPERGRFRSFLLASVRNFLANERDRMRALKRGRGRPPLSLDLQGAETSCHIEAVEANTPEKEFERRWALTLLDRVLRRLEEEQEKAGHQTIFLALKPFLTAIPEVGYREVAAELQMTEGAVKVAMHRLRKRFGILLREEVADTASRPEEVDDEIRYLFVVLGS